MTQQPLTHHFSEPIANLKSKLLFHHYSNFPCNWCQMTHIYQPAATPPEQHTCPRQLKLNCKGQVYEVCVCFPNDITYKTAWDGGSKRAKEMYQ